jgi:hypothetical protein
MFGKQLGDYTSIIQRLYNDSNHLKCFSVVGLGTLLFHLPPLGCYVSCQFKMHYMEATPDYKILLELSQIKLAQFAEEYNSLVIAPGFVFLT